MRWGQKREKGKDMVPCLKEVNWRDCGLLVRGIGKVHGTLVCKFRSGVDACEFGCSQDGAS